MTQPKKIMIIGAGSDVGKELAVILAKAGFNLVLTKMEFEELEPLVSDLRIRYGSETELIVLDALDFENHTSILKPYMNSVDDVFCFVGYLGDQKVAQENWQETNRIIDINFKGVVSILNFIANIFENKSNGTIVAVSSVAGNRGRQSNYFYGSAKAALTTYLSGLRNRMYKSNVHVMTVLPGFMKTKMTAHLELPGILTATPDKAARIIFKAYRNKRNIIYVLPKWRYLMMIICSIPEFIFKRLSL